MLPFLGSLVNGAVSIFGAIFQTKAARMEAVAVGISKSMEVLKAANATDGEIAAAVSAVVASEAQSESILARNWRPLAMILIMALIIAFMWGKMPPNINGAMPPLLTELFDILKIGLCGYIPARSLEKIARMFMTPKLVESITKSLTGIK